MTVHELVRAERMVGLDARLVEVGNDCESNLVNKAREEITPPMRQALGAAAGPAVEVAINYLKSKDQFKASKVEPGTEDRGLKVEGIDWAKNEADVLVGHSGFPDSITNLDKPYIMCMHGRPRSSFLLELHGEYPIYSGYLGLGQQHRIRKFITFWKEHIPNESFLISENKIAYVPACVDMDMYNPEGEKAQLMNPGKFNILIADVWRDDIDPYDVLHACHYFCKKHPKAKFHMFGCKPTSQLGPWRILIGKAKSEGTIGTHVGMIADMPNVYRTVDMMVTPQRIATRTVREALASGLPLVAADGCPYTPYKAPVWNYDRFIKEMERCYEDIKLNRDKVKIKMRESAKKHFNMMNTGVAMKKIVEEVIKDWREVGRDETVAFGQMKLDSVNEEVEAVVM